MTTLDYRLRIRNDDDTADLLSYSTIPGLNPYVLGAPKGGDGQSFDPIDGSFVLGSYSFSVVDAGISAGSTAGGVVSAHVADLDNRYRLVSHLAYAEFSENSGATWQVYLTGYVNRVRKVTALIWEFTIGDSLRVDQRVTLFKEKSQSFDKMSCLIGGPVIGGFGFIKDYGPWVMKTKSYYDGIVVQLHFVHGYVRRTVENFFFQFPTGGFNYVEGGYTHYEEKKVNAIADAYRVETSEFYPQGVGSKYPRLEARIEDLSGNLIGLFMVLNSRDPAYSASKGWTAGGLHAILTGGDLNVYWPNTGTNPATGLPWPAYPTLHDHIQISVYALDVSETTPVHIFGHPVDLHTQAYDDAHIPYDATSAAATKVAIGAALRLALRPTKSMSLQAFGTSLQGMFGYSVRQAGGKRVFFPTRMRSIAAPSVICTADDIYDPSSVIFDQDEKGIINQVQLTLETYALWAPEKFGKDSARPVDELVTTRDPVTIKTEDAVYPAEQGIYGVHEQKYELQGQILLDTFHHMLFDFHTQTAIPTRTFLEAITEGAGGIFDRRQRGAILGELRCLRGGPGGMSALLPGDEFLAAIPWQQNINNIGGQRIVQVLKRTETPVGPTLNVEDCGTTAQTGTLPTFTFVPDTLDPRHFSLFTITNAAALISDSVPVRIELGVGASPASFSLFGVLTPAQLAAGKTTFRLPKANAGSVHTIRLQGSKHGLRPTAYTTPITSSLTPLAAPSSLAFAAIGGDASSVKVSWANGETDKTVQVRYKKSGTTAWRTVIMPALSTSTTLMGLDPVAYNFSVEHRDELPYDGISSSITGNYTPGSPSKTMLKPENPSPFSGAHDDNGVFINDGTFGMEVTAMEFPCEIEFQVALETAVGSGAFGSYDSPPRGVLSASQRPSRTRLVLTGASDGLKRRIQAKATRIGAIDSPWTDALDVIPFTALRPIEYKVDVPVIALSYDATTQGNSARGEVVITFTAPTVPQHGHMEYSVRQRVPAGTWGLPSIVIGTKTGPDTITAQAGQQYGVTPITVTLNDETRNVGATEYFITIPTFSLGGPAGGDLTGTYPNPTLVLIGSATGPIGDGTHVPVVTIDAKGRTTGLTSTPITFPTAGAVAFVGLTDGATITWATAGAAEVNASVTINGNRTLAITGAVSGQCGILRVTQGSGGGFSLTLPSGSKVRNSGAGVIALSPSAGDVDVLGYMFDGTFYLWTYGDTFT